MACQAYRKSHVNLLDSKEIDVNSVCFLAHFFGCYHLLGFIELQLYNFVTTMQNFHLSSKSKSYLLPLFSSSEIIFLDISSPEGKKIFNETAFHGAKTTQCNCLSVLKCVNGYVFLQLCFHLILMYFIFIYLFHVFFHDFFHTSLYSAKSQMLKVVLVEIIA